MAQCEECKRFYPLPENPETGDCVGRGEDARQAFYQAKPVAAAQDASSCQNFQKK